MKRLVLLIVAAGICFATACDSGAGFLLPQFTLSVTIEGEGTVTRVEGEGTVEVGGDLFGEGTEVTLTATPADGWRFDRWEGDATGTEPTTSITMDSDKNVTAVFIQQFMLSVNTDGAGTVKAEDTDGVASFEEEFDAGAEAMLTAAPADGWRFDRWEGDATGSNVTIAVTMDSDKNVTAVFIQRFTLAVNTEGEGTVSVDNADGVSSFQEDFDAGDQVVLTVEPADGWWFQQWEGDATGSGSPMTVTLDADKNITAVFLAVAGQRVVTVDGVLGRMTIAMRGTTIKGVRRSNDFGADLDGTISGDQITLTSSSPGFSDATINATIQSDGSWVGTINGSGFTNDPFVADPVDFTGFDDDVAGLRTTQINLDGLLALAVQAGVIQGTWRVFGSFGADVQGTVNGNLITFTLTTPGFQSGTVTATVQADGSWVGTIDGSGYNNEPFAAQPSFFP